MHAEPKELTLILPPSMGPISLSVFDSDLIANTIALDTLVGTLVKFENIDHFNPYLASSWKMSEDQKTWTFIFHSGLRAEDGTVINAQTYRENLLRLLKLYSKTHSPNVFNKLVGWNDFLRGDVEQIGIKASSELELELKFSEVTSGLLVFFSIPHFGFFTPSNFDGDNWKDNHKIISSGPYRLESFAGNELRLKIREDWPLLENQNELFHSAKIIMSPWEEVIKSGGHFLIRLKGDEVTNESFRQHKAAPTKLGSIVLSPYLAPFNDLKVRRAFRRVIREKMKSYNQEGMCQYFYPFFSEFSLQEDSYEEALQLLRNINSSGIKVFNMYTPTRTQDDVLANILRDVLFEVGWNVSHENIDTLGNRWMKEGLDSEIYHIRTAGVDIGERPFDWLVELMFCTRLGVSFPDIDNRFRTIVKNYSMGKFKEEKKFWESLHEALEESSAVVPILHVGHSWFVSKELDINQPMVNNTPRLDLVKMK